MQTLSALTQQESARHGHDAVWVLSIDWPDAPVHYAHRNATLADGILPATLLEPGDLSSEKRNGAGPATKRPVTRLKASLALDGSESPSLRERLAETDPEGLEATWRLVFLDTQGATELSDGVILFFGVVQRAIVTRRALESIHLEEIESNGYSFQIETTYRALCAGMKVVEVPIVFVDRRAGHSKMDGRIFLEAVGVVWRLRRAQQRMLP